MLLINNGYKWSAAILLSALLCVSSSWANDAYHVEVVYTADYWTNKDGGIEEADAYLDNLDLTLQIDMDKAVAWKGGTAFVYLLYNNAETFSEKIVGDAQGVSNIDNSHVIRAYELWYEQSFAENQSVKFGLYDLNSEFDAIDTASFFINSSHGIGPDYSQSGENGPSIFPTTSLGVRYFLQYNDQLSIRFALLDAVPGDPLNSQNNTINLSSDEGALVAFEVNHQSDKNRIGVGTWYYTEETKTLEGDDEENNAGFYGIFEHQLMTAGTQGKDLSAYLRSGLAKASINQFDSYVGAGVVLSAFIPGRVDDALGFAVASVRNGDDYRDVQAMAGGASDRRELIYELTYRTQLLDRLSMQPNFQFIKNPGTDPSLDDTWVVGVRFELLLHH